MAWWSNSMCIFRAYLFFDEKDQSIVSWMQRYGVTVLRIAVGIIFLWFGTLKILGFSPVTELVEKTVYWFDPAWFVPLLGWWEAAIGLCFIIRPLVRLGILLLVPQILGTFLPLLLLPHIVFQNGNAFFPTLEGHYIIKNLIIIGAAIVIGAHVREKNFAKNVD
jgi:uncharacterized membrane protein YkgB